MFRSIGHSRVLAEASDAWVPLESSNAQTATLSILGHILYYNDVTNLDLSLLIYQTNCFRRFFLDFCGSFNEFRIFRALFWNLKSRKCQRPRFGGMENWLVESVKNWWARTWKAINGEPGDSMWPSGCLKRVNCMVYMSTHSQGRSIYSFVLLCFCISWGGKSRFKIERSAQPV